MIEVVNAYPPNLDIIRNAFPIHSGVIFTYGGKIYSPDSMVISPELHAHEAIHVKQQGDDPDVWWDKYIIDVEWRLEQEIEAHRAEWKYVLRNIKNREVRAKYLSVIAARLSGKLYGNMLPYPDAVKKIKQLSAYR